MMIETRSLSKHYGAIRAVDALDLTVVAGEVFGLLGPNGGGKTTTMKLLLDAISPTSGTARIFGLDVHDHMIDIHRRVGYLPGDLTLPGELTGSAYLDFLGALRARTDARLVAELCERLDLDLSRRLGQLSTGNQQKVGLVQAFMHRPDLVLLDEPTTGLDPLVQHEVHAFLGAQAGEGTTVLLSSHVLSEVDRVADRVGVLRSGRLVAVDTVALLKQHAQSVVGIDFATPPDWTPLRTLAGVRSLEAKASSATLVVEGTIDPILRVAVGMGTIVAIHTPEADLEDVFLGYYRDASNPAQR